MYVLQNYPLKKYSMNTSSTNNIYSTVKYTSKFRVLKSWWHCTTLAGAHLKTSACVVSKSP